MQKKCKHCDKELKFKLINLGKQPYANSLSYKKKKINKYPLEVYICDYCALAQQTYAIKSKVIFSRYSYYSSYSNNMLRIAKNFCNEIKKKYLKKNSFVLEIASNDGYLLKNFKNQNIKILGVEPAKNIAKLCRKLGIETINDFFTKKLSYKIIKKYGYPDFIIANNVIAHIPDLIDFFSGLRVIINKKNYLSVEFQYFLNLVRSCQFDTVYHEHFYYYSVKSIQNILHSFNLKIVKIESINTHGGSLRLLIADKNNILKEDSSIEKYIKNETKNKIHNKRYLNKFKIRAKKIKLDLLKFLDKAKKNNKIIIGFGAAAKTTVLLNYLGKKYVKNIKLIIDDTKYKQNKFVPGVNIKIKSREALNHIKADYIIIFPWNHINEIIKKFNSNIIKYSKFVIAIPKLKIFSY